ncbi:MAG TPA: phosphatase PAP2 family protein [Acidimicrobiales bacterium]|nr:phosphatase PAP2 family protein [Acidimicrobiales bacterium]
MRARAKEAPAPAAPGWRGGLLGPRLWWQEVIAMFVCYEVFERLRGVIPEPTVSPFHHALQVVRIERALGLFRESALQQWFLSWHLAIQFFDVYYGTVHFVIPVVALVILWKRNRDRYAFMRNSAGFMLALAFAGFLLWPLAPPRLLPASYHFVDTPATIGGMGALDRGNLKDDNQVAAMPSLHIGWSTWCAVALLPVLRRRWAKAAVVAYPFLTLLTVMVTANHYWLDGVGGLVVLSAGMGLETLRSRAVSRARTPSSSHPADVEAEDSRVARVDGRHDP